MVRKPPPHWASVRETPPPARRRGFARLAGAQIVRKTPPLRAQTPTPCRDNRQLAACERPIVRKPPPPARAPAEPSLTRDRGPKPAVTVARRSPAQLLFVRKTPPPGPAAIVREKPAFVRKTPPLAAPTATLFSELSRRLPVPCGNKRTANRAHVGPRGAAAAGDLPEGYPRRGPGVTSGPAPHAPPCSLPAGKANAAAGAAQRRRAARAPDARALGQGRDRRA